MAQITEGSSWLCLSEREASTEELAIWQTVKGTSRVIVLEKYLDQLATNPQAPSSVDNVIVNAQSNDKYGGELLGAVLQMVKPNGTVALRDNGNGPDDQVMTNLKLAGFLGGRQQDKLFLCEKPNYEIGSAAKLSLGKKPVADKAKIAAVWKLDDDEMDEEMIDADNLLDDADKVKPDPTSLRVCGTTGKRKACKDCSCGLADELASENAPQNPTSKSSCGSCYLGDAFRCASCPYLGMPAFKPGETVQLSDVQMAADM